MASPVRVQADIDQARSLAKELEQWVDRLEADMERDGSANAVLAKRRELYDVHRQLKALHEKFPQAFA